MIQVPLSAFKLGAGSKLDQAPDGTQALFVGYGSNALADLGTTPLQLQDYTPGQPPYLKEGLYTLSFDVANYLPNYPGEYDVEVDFGTQKLCEVYGWGQKAFTTVMVTCPGPAYIVLDKSLPGGGPVQGSKDFVIGVSNPGWTLMLRNFSLNFTPQP